MTIHFRRTFEAVTLQESQDGTFTGRIIVEGMSRNRNAMYTREAIASGVRAFTGGKIVANHPEDRDTPSRPIEDVVGRITEAWTEEQGGKLALMGRYQISDAEPAIKTKIREGIIDGASIEAFSRADPGKDGVLYVREFVTPDMVDEPITAPRLALVVDPAAGGSIGWEAVRESILAGTLADVTPDEIRSLRPDLFDDVSQDTTIVNFLEEGIMPDGQVEFTTEEIQNLREDVTRLSEENERLAAQIQRVRESVTVSKEIASSLDGLHEATIARVRKQIDAVLAEYEQAGGELASVRETINAIIQEEQDYAAQLAPGGIPGGLTLSVPTATSEDVLAEIDQVFEEITKGR